MNNMASPSHASSQFHQLPMFMTGEELGNLHSGDYGGRVKDVSERDFNDAHDVADTDTYREGSPDHAHYMNTLTQGVERESGIVEPVHVWHPNLPAVPELVDGHHRAKVARETGRLVPVEHHVGDRDKVHHSVFLKGLDLL